jgi:putative SOS response-associated peptidase YedK
MLKLGEAAFTFPQEPDHIHRRRTRKQMHALTERTVGWGRRHLALASRATDSSVAASMINARAGTASTKPVFCDALKSRRCLIPAHGFYEWARTGKAKQPYCFEVGEGELFAFAGIWDRWEAPTGNWVKTC